jgi:hypothetical protein
LRQKYRTAPIRKRFAETISRHFSALYSPCGIANTFAEPKIIPMVNIYEFDAKRNPLKHSPEGVQALVNLLERRMDTQQIFASDRERDDLIRASGGHLRHLMQMVREACLTAIGRGHDKIEADDAAYTINQRQFSFEREIPDSHYAAISNTYRTKRSNNDEIGQLTLVNTSVLEYNGKRPRNLCFGDRLSPPASIISQGYTKRKGSTLRRNR